MSYSSDNAVTFNRIDGFKLQGSFPDASLGDGGGIYALGPQKNSVMKGNWLNNMGAGLGGGAFYPDEGSTVCVCVCASECVYFGFVKAIHPTS